MWGDDDDMKKPEVDSKKMTKFDVDPAGITITKSQCNDCKKNIDGDKCQAYNPIPMDFLNPLLNMACAEREQEFKVDDY